MSTKKKVTRSYSLDYEVTERLIQHSGRAGLSINFVLNAILRNFFDIKSREEVFTDSISKTTSTTKTPSLVATPIPNSTGILIEPDGDDEEDFETPEPVQEERPVLKNDGKPSVEFSLNDGNIVRDERTVGGRRVINAFGTKK
jgi:hypothetical protein